MASGVRMKWELLCRECTKLGMAQPQLSPCQIGERWTCSVEGVYCVNAGAPNYAIEEMLTVLAGWEACLDNQGCKDLITVSAICGAKEAIYSAILAIHRSKLGLNLTDVTQVINNEFATLLEESCKTT